MNIIKFTCYKCKTFFSKTEQQVITEKQAIRYCDCGRKLGIEVIDLSSLLETEIKKVVSEYVTKWFNSDGIEYTIQLIDNCTIPKIKEYYINELKERGLK